MAFQRMHPCSSERTETATFTSGEGDEDHVSNALKRLKEKKKETEQEEGREILAGMTKIFPGLWRH